MANESIRVARLEYTVKALEIKLSDHEIRMRDVEKTIWKAVGALALLQVIITLAITFIKHT